MKRSLLTMGSMMLLALILGACASTIDGSQEGTARSVPLASQEDVGPGAVDGVSIVGDVAPALDPAMFENAVLVEVVNPRLVKTQRSEFPGGLGIVYDAYEVDVIALHSTVLDGIEISEQVTFFHPRWSNDPAYLSGVQPQQSVFLLFRSAIADETQRKEFEEYYGSIYRVDDGFIADPELRTALPMPRQLPVDRQAAQVVTETLDLMDLSGIPSPQQPHIGLRAGAAVSAWNDPASGLREAYRGEVDD